MGMHEYAWRTMNAVWETTMSSCRDIQDIDRFRKALDRIIEAKGSYVEEYDFRHGHRKVTQKLVSGGALILTAEVNFTDRAMEGMRELEASWEGLTQPK